MSRYPYGVVRKTKNGLTYTGFYSRESISEWKWKNNIKDKMLIINSFTHGEQFDPSYSLSVEGDREKWSGILIYGDLKYSMFLNSLQQCYDELQNINYHGDFLYLKSDANWNKNPKLKQMSPIITVKKVES